MYIDVIILIILFIAMLIFCRYSLKRWKKAKIIWIIILIVALIACIIIAYRKTSFHSFSLNTDDKYIVTTSDINYTYFSDGGTHYDTYYEIDFSKNKIELRQDYVYANMSSLYTVRFLKSYSGKLIAKGTLDDLQIEQLKKLFANRLSEGSYTLESDEDDLINNIFTDASLYLISSKNIKNIKMSEEETNKFRQIISSSIKE